MQGGEGEGAYTPLPCLALNLQMWAANILDRLCFEDYGIMCNSAETRMNLGESNELNRACFVTEFM